MNPHFFKNKRVLVTGACGTVGSQIVHQLLTDHEVGELVGLDNNESALFFLEQKFSRYFNAHFYLADIRDPEKLAAKFKGVDIVFHTAAFKHVVLCERSPFEAVQTNIIGVRNVINASQKCNVQRVVFTSSDKAVNPTNVMGTSKLMGERLMTAANSNTNRKGPIFVSTRFGNVLGSHGSVIPIFKDQIRRGGPVTLTDPAMTRFIMSIDEATRLVVDSSIISNGGEVFVTKMPAIRIKDLAEVMIDELAPRYGYRPEDIEIKMIGYKAGEKLYEELMSHEETRRALELDLYYVILPAFKSVYHNINYQYPDTISDQVGSPYHSANEEPLPKDKLRKFLTENKLMDAASRNYCHTEQVE